MSDMVDLPRGYRGLQHPIIKTPPGIWAIIDHAKTGPTHIPPSWIWELVSRFDDWSRKAIHPWHTKHNWFLFNQRVKLVKLLRHLGSPGKTIRSNDVTCVDIVYTRDDPNFEFLESTDIAGMTPDFINNCGFSFRGPRAVVNAYNAPFRASNVMRIRRATDFNSIALLMDPHYAAKEIIAKWREQAPSIPSQDGGPDAA